MTIIKRQTLYGTLYSYIGVLVGALSQAYLIPNFFSTEQNGLIQILFSYIYIFVILGSLGFNQAGNRFFSKFRSSDNNHKGYLALGLKTSLIGFFIVSVTLFLFKSQLLQSKGDNQLFSKYYFYLYPLIFLNVIFNLFDNYNKGLYNTIYGTFLSQFLTRFIGLVLVLLVVVKIFDFDQYMHFWPLIFVIPTVLMLISSYRLGDFSLKSSDFFKNADFRSDFYRASFFSILSSLSVVVITHMDKIFVYKYLGLEQTGIYSICVLFGSVMSMALISNAKASTSIVVDALHSNDIPKIQKIFKKSGLTQLIFGILLLIVVWVSIDQLFGLIKPVYSAGKIAVIIIGFAKLFDLSNGVNSLILINSKYFKYDTYLSLSFVLILVGLNMYFIPNFGLNGAAFAALLATLYFNSARSIILYNKFRITPFSIEQIKALLLGAICLFLGFLLPTIPDLPMATLIYKSSSVGFIFILLIFVFNISEDINKLIRDITYTLIRLKG